MPERRRIVKKRIGEILIERGIITKEQLQEALDVQTDKKKLLGEILIDLGHATEEEVMISLTTQYGIPYLPIESYEVNPEIIKSVPKELVHKFNFIPVDKIGDMLTIAVSDIPGDESIQQIEESLNCKVESFITTPGALRKAIEKYY